ncbi:MAG: redoxin domain-containing protein [Flavobacterium sp.]|nr:redoxin domain-containing protein [Flavobacterium sp.]
MKTQSLLVLFFVFTTNSSLLAQAKKTIPASQIEFQSSEYANKMYYLASHYGKYQTLLDSVKGTNEGKLLFKKNQKYVEGIYMLVTPDKKIELEFMMDSDQKFAIQITNPTEKTAAVTNSALNQDFNTFNAFFKTKMEGIKTLEKTLADKKTKQDSAVVIQDLKKIQSEINNYKNDYIQSNPSNTLALLFRMSQPIDNFLSKPTEEKLATKTDSIAYLKKHFFDGIDFKDSRLLRNPFLENRITAYFNTFVPVTPEAVTTEITQILNQTDLPNGEVFKYLSLHFVDLYSEPKIMGMDRVFINIYNTYFKNKEYAWLQLKQKEFFKFKVASIKDNLVGDKGRNLFMLTQDQKRIDLYDIKAKYTVLAFWDPTCGHCATEIPKMHQLYETDWKQKGVVVFAINNNTNEMVKWKEFIEKEKLFNWINVYPAPVVTGNYTKDDVDFQTLYNVRQTPVIYLLDQDKKIIAKKVGPENYTKIIEQLEKKK